MADGARKKPPCAKMREGLSLVKPSMVLGVAPSFVIWRRSIPNRPSLIRYSLDGPTAHSTIAVAQVMGRLIQLYGSIQRPSCRPLTRRSWPGELSLRSS